MRNIMKSPAPRVLAWDSSDKNAVKAEYIIMEKARGVQLGTVWPTIDSDQKVQVIRAVARHQRAWSKISFSCIGSLYYKKDLPTTKLAGPVFFDGSDKPATDSEFAIGPVMGREWMDFGRANIDCDRGPCEYFGVLPMAVPLTQTVRDINRKLQASSVRSGHAGCSKPQHTAKALLDALRSLALPAYPGQETPCMRSCSSSPASHPAPGAVGIYFSHVA